MALCHLLFRQLPVPHFNKTQDDRVAVIAVVLAGLYANYLLITSLQTIMPVLNQSVFFTATCPS